MSDYWVTTSRKVNRSQLPSWSLSYRQSRRWSGWGPLSFAACRSTVNKASDTLAVMLDSTFTSMKDDPAWYTIKCQHTTSLYFQILDSETWCMYYFHLGWGWPKTPQADSLQEKIFNRMSAMISYKEKEKLPRLTVNDITMWQKLKTE